MTNISFSKYSGAGNDFILIDHRTACLPRDLSALSRTLCARRTSVGADGVILLQPSSRADGRMRIFNSDGSEADMCGNGLRCLVKFLKDTGECQDSCRIEAGAHLYTASFDGDLVRVVMPPPTTLSWNQTLTTPNGSYQVDLLHTGAPHVVLFVEEIADAPVITLGRCMRQSEQFQPEGTNVTFATKTESNHLSIRTYEKGVEDETLACGTGAVAAALALAWHAQESDGITQVRVRSGDTLSIEHQWEAGAATQIAMTGPARRVYQGGLEL